jgi:hypothetical protein
MLLKKIAKRGIYVYRKKEEHWFGKQIIKNSKRTSPNFMIIGVAKCGTTSLFQYLAQHPKIIPSKRKEVKYFRRKWQYRGMHWYLNNFPLKKDSKNKLTFEASPPYLCAEHAVKRIHYLFPKMKFITIFRDPVKRAYSNWNFYHDRSITKNRTKYYDNRSFEEAIEDEMTKDGCAFSLRYRYLFKGFYAQHLRHWYQYYSPEQILILDFDELKNDPKTLLGKVTNFLNVDYVYEDFSNTNKKSLGHKLKKDKNNDNTIKQYNTTPYKEKMNQETEEKLQTIFAPYNEDLKRLTGRTFSWVK